jgi:acetoin:2,6-dichlorophenolindophenol oxidoreductase subunit beta
MTTPESSRRFTVTRAVAEAIAQEMRADPHVFVMGEDIAALGGVFGNTRGLLEEFGAERIRDTPISETAFIGAGVGAAAAGMRPIVELMFVDFFGVCFDSIYNLAAKQSYFSGGKVSCPMVLMTFAGGGYSDGGQHSQCLWASFAHMPGLKVVVPSNAYDAKGMMLSAIRDWLGTEPGSVVEVPEEPYLVPLGKAKTVRAGNDITIIGLALTVHHALHAATELAKEGIDAEVIDLRSVVPLDRQAIIASVAKTGRLLVVDEDYSSFSVSSEVIATVVENDVSQLKAPPRRIAYPDVVIPFSPPMEQFALPNAQKIVATVREMMAREVAHA